MYQLRNYRSLIQVTETVRWTVGRGFTTGIDARPSACGRRADNEVSRGTKFTEGSEAVGFLLLAPRGTKTGLSPSRTEGSCEAAVDSNAPPGEANS